MTEDIFTKFSKFIWLKLEFKIKSYKRKQKRIKRKEKKRINRAGLAPLVGPDSAQQKNRRKEREKKRTWAACWLGGRWASPQFGSGRRPVIFFSLFLFLFFLFLLYLLF